MLQHAPNSLIEHALQVPLRECRALEVLLCLDLLRHHDGLLILDGRHLLLPQALARGLVIAQIQLRADEDDGDAGGVVLDLGIPLCRLASLLVDRGGGRASHLRLDVVERRRAHNGKANQEHVCLRIRQRPKTVIIFLAGSIPQSQAYGLAIDHNIRRVVVEPEAPVSDVEGLCPSRPYSHSWDVFAGEGIGGVRDQQTRLDKQLALHLDAAVGGRKAAAYLAYCTVTRHHTLRHRVSQAIFSGGRPAGSLARTFRDWVAGAVMVVAVWMEMSGSEVRLQVAQGQQRGVSAGRWARRARGGGPSVGGE